MVIDLGEQPSPEIEPAEPPPGGVDAVEDALFEEQPLVPDLTRIGNEGARVEVPDPITEPDGADAGDPDEGEEVTG